MGVIALACDAMSRRASLSFAIAAAIAAGACTDVGNDGAPNPSGSLSEAVFQCKVEPVLIRDCSYTGCHGNAGFPLRVYSPGKLRATTPSTLDDAIAALTTAEHHANFESAAAFAFGDVAPDDNLLLRMNLPAAVGGFGHKGGAAFVNMSDPGYVAIHDWLAGTGTCP